MLLPIYLVTAIVAGGLVLFSALTAGSSGADVDFDADADFDMDTDMATDADLQADTDVGPDIDLAGHGVSGWETFASWLPFTSLRFWLYSVAFFGVTGTALTLLQMAKEPTVLIASITTGVITGTLVSIIAKFLIREAAGDAVRAADFNGVAGRLLVGISSGRPGKVRVTVKGDIIDLVAVTDDGSDIPVDSRVVIVRIEGDRAVVISEAFILQELQNT